MLFRSSLPMPRLQRRSACHDPDRSDRCTITSLELCLIRQDEHSYASNRSRYTCTGTAWPFMPSYLGQRVCLHSVRIQTHLTNIIQCTLKNNHVESRKNSSQGILEIWCPISHTSQLLRHQFLVSFLHLPHSHCSPCVLASIHKQNDGHQNQANADEHHLQPICNR